MAVYPIIPEWITVHLGAPDEDAPNVTISFPDYIKNVASSELYPTWPESAIRANILAQISFALNRVYTEYYPSRGYSFDITNDISRDQSYFEGRDIFENISRIVDGLFDSYIRRTGSIEPLFARYCDGVKTQCDGLSQWETVSLAEGGLGAYDILTSFYGNDIELVENVPVAGIEASLPLAPLRIGSSGNDVLGVQVKLNRISANFPAIPKIPDPNGLYDEATRQAVLAFQEVNGLVPDGIVGKETWYRIQYIWGGVKKLSELDSEGLAIGEIPRDYPTVLAEGDRGGGVFDVQYMLAFLAQYEDVLPKITPDGIFGKKTGDAVEAFRRLKGLPDGREMDESAYLALYEAYVGILRTLPSDLYRSGAAPYPGSPLLRGSMGENVALLQGYLNTLSRIYPSLGTLEVTANYDVATENAVKEYQRLSSLPVTGVVSATVWNQIASEYDDILASDHISPGQYPGFDPTTQGGNA